NDETDATYREPHSAVSGPVALDSQTLENSSAWRTEDLLATDSLMNAQINRAYEFADLASYSFLDRLQIRAADCVFYLLIELIGWDNHDKAEENGGLPIYVFWHDRIFLTTYWWRNRRIVVMTSRSFDGEYIARFIQRFGYGAVRGSSTRGAVGAVIEMARLMREGCTAAFTIDGPKGPRYVAKMR